MVNENESEGKPDILAEVAAGFDELRAEWRGLADEREDVAEAWERLKEAREEFRLEKSAAADAVRQAELARGEAKLGAMLRGHPAANPAAAKFYHTWSNMTPEGRARYKMEHSNWEAEVDAAVAAYVAGRRQ